MDRVYLENHKKKSNHIFINFKNKDLYMIEFDFLQYEKEQEKYFLYDYKIFHYSGVFYVVNFRDQGINNYKMTFKNIDEVNGFIKTLYKVFYKVINPGMVLLWN